jgi:hypothetical protein
MAGLVPAIHVLLWEWPKKKDVDGRDKPGLDDPFALVCIRTLT